MSLSLRQARAALVAEFSFKQRLERIAWEENVMKPELERLSIAAGQNLEIPEFSITDEDPED